MSNMKRSAPPVVLDRETRIRLYDDLLRVRMLEEGIARLYRDEQQMRCPTHFSIGQEAAAVGVFAHARREDYAISAHRSHAHYLCKGGDLKRMMAELYGKATGCAGGKGGSMHLIATEVNFLGCVPIVGSTMPIGVGASYSAWLRGEQALSIICFGDGAVETGLFHESVNFAALNHLPVLFVCENNLYSVNTPMSVRQSNLRSITDLAHGHGIRADQEDGQDVEAVYRRAASAFDDLRAGEGPVLLELMTYRWLEHCGPLSDTHLDFRPDGEFERWTARCPLRIQEERLLAEGLLDAETIAAKRAAIEAEFKAAVDFAHQSPFPERRELAVGLYV
ncbi:thiamine pyrophosphate-dependent dehydrogenase E1 component subunit alpha [Ferrovibrio sp.]|uniref:thiamine pyrophosphate-dependent dehydrogenase E1 component subunit alpha n=1 Tax=Ferrovibrio sp. TaxID=1917215 RepID=UPI0025BC6370|nr:thiamine pyrophosphate-dependent dehydrogenase E1 component subunit alpha [Ferrovibrio sp.]MBX3454254.1 thiamine pyrophosphate-dependent dehydrogenase E1 component subunit alpha [Ferrovibrio sp.]